MVAERLLSHVQRVIHADNKRDVIQRKAGERLVLRPEEHARETIDKLLSQAGWVVCDPDKASIHASAGVAAREFPLKSSQGFAAHLYCPALYSTPKRQDDSGGRVRFPMNAG